MAAMGRAIRRAMNRASSSPSTTITPVRQRSWTFSVSTVEPTGVISLSISTIRACPLELR